MASSGTPAATRAPKAPAVAPASQRGDKPLFRRLTVARMCVVSGDGLHLAMARQSASFTIEARDAEGVRQQVGGDVFMVAIRGSSKVNAKVADNEDGSYKVEYKPSTSGSYAVSVALNGVPLPDSPFPLTVLTPAPDAVRCVLRGDALTKARARELATFEIEFMNAMGQPARAEEVDVWVMRVPKEVEGKDANGDPLPVIVAVPAAVPRGADDKLHASGKPAKGAKADGSASSAAQAPAPAPGANTLKAAFTAAVATTTLAADAAASRAKKEDVDPEESKRIARRTFIQLRAEALARGGGRVQVGDKPLIMRSEARLDSPVVTVLAPGQLVTVIEERILEDDGKVRARVALIDEDAATSAIAESWWSPTDLAMPVDAFGMRLLTSTERAHLASTSSNASTATASSQSISLSTALIAVGVPPLQTQRFGHPERQGWVTLMKNGAELVAERPRLNASERQKHMALWKSRDSNDKARKAALAAMGKRLEAKGGEKEAPTGSVLNVGPSLKNELDDDPMGIGFAFGGIHPGTLHAGGKNVKTHTVSYSIGAAGHYRLHVGLRNQAIALPGSPFDLYVKPSTAHAPSTSLPPEGLPLRGVVGDDWSCTCTLHAADRMGNRCIAGGAKIVVDCGKDPVDTRCTDNEDGSYTLQWKGKAAGLFRTQVRIDGAHVIGSPLNIKMHAGPPDITKCVIAGSGLRNAVAGQQALVQITCKDRFANPLSADSLQGAALSFGLALMLPGAEGKAASATVESMPFEGGWVKSTDVEGQCFEIAYTAKEAGDFELNVWCDPDGTGTRRWLSGSPFPVRVSGVRPSTSGSYIGGVDWLLANTMTAGETVILKPQLRDQFGNASSAAEGDFQVFIEAPDGMHKVNHRSLKGLGAYEVSYEVQIKGKHQIQFLLRGEHIQGSPVEFDVIAAPALGTKCRLFPPLEPPIIKQPCEIMLEAIDRYGNKLDRGGQRIDARANGPGVSGCTTDDKGNGTYIITFSAAVVGECRVTVRVDNVEMEPLKLVFVAPQDGGDKTRKSKEAVEIA